MNLLVIAGSLRHTQAGAAHATLDFANETAEKEGIKVYLYTFEVDPSVLNPKIQVISYKEPKSVRFFWRFDYIMRYFQFVAELRRHNLDDVNLCYTQNDVWGLTFRKLYPNVPIVSHTGAVLSHREYMEERAGIKSFKVRYNAWLARWFEHRSYRAKRWAHIVSTPLVAKTRETYFKLPEGFFHVAPFGVDLNVFKPTKEKKIRKELGIPEDAIVIITVCRLVAWKQVNMVISSLARLGRENVFLLILGDGKEKQVLIQQSKNLGFEKRCIFMGHIKNPAPFYNESDIFVLPSKIESFGIVYAEAMVFGLPCIGLRNNPPEVLSTAIDVIDEGKSGFCVSTEDELTEKLNLLINNSNLRRKMGDYASELARTKYSWERYIRDFFTIVEKEFGIQLSKNNN